MSQVISKIISASAGTGKTYRLSLEYLALLLKHYHTPDFRPDQILVITFTRKATAEIRDRIYLHLQTISAHMKGWQALAVNLKQLTGDQTVPDNENPLSESEQQLIHAAYQHLMTNKDQLQVMTIDSFVHSVFRNLVRPVRGIDRFELDLRAVEKRLPFLFKELMSPALQERMQKLLTRKLKPSLDEYSAFFRSLIDNRWTYYLACQREVYYQPESLADYARQPAVWETKARLYQKSFLDIFISVINHYASYLIVNHNVTYCKEAINGNWLNKEFVQLFSPPPERVADFAAIVTARSSDPWFLQQLLKLLKADKFLWNGKKVRSSKKQPFIDDWKQLHKQAGEFLADYLIFDLLLPEQQEILDIWKHVLSHYDKLIYKYKNFTYDDIAWFTFEALYSSEPPLFEAESEMVANEFYDFMSRRTRFMLIDEFQDTSILQFNILQPMLDELLAGEGTKPYGGMIIVGDEKQSIFGWRGGQRDLLLNLEAIFPSMQAHTKAALTDSWRSSPTLMHFINGIFAHPLLQDYLLSRAAVWKYQEITGRKAELEPETTIHFKLQNYCNGVPGSNKTETIRSFVQDMVIPNLPHSSVQNRSMAILARTNDELETIRTLLAERGITSEFQSSKSLLEHPAVLAMLYLLRFSIYHDWYDFLAFLRSDLILMDGATLKSVIQLISAHQNTLKATAAVPEGVELEPDFGMIPIAAEALSLSHQLSASAIWKSCMLIFEACSVQDKILQERDFVNVQRFLDVALEYETTYQSELPTLQGFLRYCEENRDQEMLQQLDVESSSAIQLLTIHKSKGLEFDSVFVWWNLKGISDKENTQLKKYEIYADAGFKHLRDYALTLHYHKVLSASSFSEITLQEKQRSELEELNNLYVALTRAKSRLHLFVAFFKKDGWDAYWKDYEKADKLTPPHYAVAAALAYLQTHATLQDDSSYLIGTLPGQERELPSGSPLPQDLSCTPEHVPQDLSCEANPVQHDLSCTPEHVPQDLSCEANPVLQDLSCRPSILQEKSCSTYHPFWQAILPDWQQPDSLPASGLQPNPDIDFKQTYLLDRAALKGSVAHYYLSYIKYNKPDEQSVARLRTLRQFGNLLRKADLEAIIAKVDAQLPRMSTIFDPAYDLILTEYTVFQKGKEYRIDRLMLNSQAKTYCIIDFKTGGIHEPDQIALYGRIMASLLDHLGWKPESPQYLIFKL